jgi:hypothetical protein
MFTLVCFFTRDWETFYALRALQPLTQATGSLIGLVVIHDLFYVHEHARKIGNWYKSFLVVPFEGKCLGTALCRLGKMALGLLAIICAQRCFVCYGSHCF